MDNVSFPSASAAMVASLREVLGWLVAGIALLFPPLDPALLEAVLLKRLAAVLRAV